MNPKKTYDTIIEWARKRPVIQNGHWHHIRPRCLNGSDEANNLVKLTYREHYFCHYLLCLVYPEHIGLHQAYRFMTDYGKSGKVISTRLYEKAALLYENRGQNNNYQHISKQEFVKSMLWKQFYYLQNLTPSDEDIIMGYRNNKGQYPQVWKNWYKNEKEWVEDFRYYISVYPIPESKDPRRPIHNSGNNLPQARGLLLTGFRKFLCYSNITNPTDEEILRGNYNVHDNKFYQKWKLYYNDGNEWIADVRKNLTEWPITKEELSQYEHYLDNKYNANRQSAAKALKELLEQGSTTSE